MGRGRGNSGVEGVVEGIIRRGVSPSDGDFVIGPCRLQRLGATAGNRQQ